MDDEINILELINNMVKQYTEDYCATPNTVVLSPKAHKLLTEACDIENRWPPDMQVFGMKVKVLRGVRDFKIAVYLVDEPVYGDHIDVENLTKIENVGWWDK